MDKMPKWADFFLVPLINLTLAFFVAGLVVLAIGQNPIDMVYFMVKGALGSTTGIGYTLYYATNFIFTGLAFAVAMHARLFNIGGEGQAAVGGLGATIVLLAVPWPHWTIALPFAILGAGVFGAAWAAIPAYLQAKRGSHIVITTIMFNFIGAALLGYLLNGILKDPTTQNAETRHFGAGAHLPTFHEMLAPFGIEFSKSAPANISFILAIVAAFGLWLLIWRTRLGYQIRAFGQNPVAAKYAGISAVRVTIIAMLISGALAGMLAINVLMGEQERMIKEFVEGAGFMGIAVALMGRNHPFGIVLAGLLFGMLNQGGFELRWEMPGISREMVLVIQALIIIFTGALVHMTRDPVERMFIRMRKRAT
ncbi:ABC transporter permease [Rhodobacteraceae bacterium R_SAG10]|jgi:simple sugar transport system permease protein|nr:ABC transporter permease [Rhodobacteraceae bacterium R_SAG10]